MMACTRLNTVFKDQASPIDLTYLPLKHVKARCKSLNICGHETLFFRINYLFKLAEEA